MGPTHLAPFHQTLRRHRKKKTSPLHHSLHFDAHSLTHCSIPCSHIQDNHVGAHSSPFPISGAVMFTATQFTLQPAVWREDSIDDAFSLFHSIHTLRSLCTHTLMPLPLCMDSFCLALWDPQSQQFKGEKDFHGNSWCIWIGPWAATICFTLGHRPVGLQISESLLLWSFLILCNHITAKKDRLSLISFYTFSPLLTMVLLLFVLCPWHLLLLKGSALTCLPATLFSSTQLSTWASISGLASAALKCWPTIAMPNRTFTLTVLLWRGHNLRWTLNASV